MPITDAVERLTGSALESAGRLTSIRQWRSARSLAPVPPGSDLLPVPGDPGPPVVGYTLPLITDPIGLGLSRYRQYGQVSWMNVLGRCFVTATGPEAAQVVLANRDKAFASSWDSMIGSFFDRGLLLLNAEEHLQHKRIMQQAFVPDRLRSYLTGMNPAIAHGIGRWHPGEGFAVHPAIRDLTLHLATEVFMGTEIGPEADRVNRAFNDCVRAPMAVVRAPIPGSHWAKGLAGRKVLEAYFTEQLPAKQAGDGTDLFSALCHARSDEGDVFTGADVVNHMIFLMFAAHDTSTMTITSMAYYLAKHPQWQRRCREESQALGDAELRYDDLDKLVSLDLVMKETLRLVPPVHMLARKTVADTEICGHFVPANTMVGTSPLVNHHMAEYWPDPERFDPERFAADRREDRVHRYAWEPFGGGVHKCIGLYFAGMQVKAIMHQLLRSYSWSVPTGYEMPLDFRSLPVPKDGLPVHLHRL